MISSFCYPFVLIDLPLLFDVDLPLLFKNGLCLYGKTFSHRDKKLHIGSVKVLLEDTSEPACWEEKTLRNMFAS